MGGRGGRSVGPSRDANQPGRTGGSAAGRHTGVNRRKAGPRGVGRHPHLGRCRGLVSRRIRHRPQGRADQPLAGNRRERGPGTAERIPDGPGLGLRPDRLAGLGAQQEPSAGRPILRLLPRLVRRLRAQLHRGAVWIRPARLLDRCVGVVMDAGTSVGLLPALPGWREAPWLAVELLVRTRRGGRRSAPCRRRGLGVRRHHR